MSKVFYVDRYKGSILSKALFADDTLLEFALGGKFVRQGPIDYSVQAMSEVDIVSVLKSGGGAEIATSVNGVLTTCVVDINLMQVVNTLRGVNGLVFIGTRQDSVDGIPFTQYIFAYNKNIISHARVMEVIQND